MIHVGAADWAAGNSIYAEFQPRPGSECIASGFALAHLSACLTRFRPRSVLELGAGIGTVTRLLLDHPAAPETIVCTEDNDFCLTQLTANLGARLDRVDLVTSLRDLLDRATTYDLIICDGGFHDALQFQGATQSTYFFFEGSRRPQRELLRQYLRTRSLGYREQRFHRSGIKIFMKERAIGPLGRMTLPKMKRTKGCTLGWPVEGTA